MTLNRRVGPGERDGKAYESRAACEDLDVFDLAAAYADALARSHAFTDGNTRLGLTATLVFLASNCVRVPHLGQARTPALAAGAVGRTEYANWLRGAG